LQWARVDKVQNMKSEEAAVWGFRSRLLTEVWVYGAQGLHPIHVGPLLQSQGDGGGILNSELRQKSNHREMRKWLQDA
jgi:hypothetical protein